MTNIEKWHQAVLTRDYALLRSILAEDIEFHSPFVFTPKKGLDQAYFILTNIFEIFDDFTYVREWQDGDDMALEFSCRVGDIIVKGIDLIHWNGDGKIDNFEVMIRPVKALMTVGELMNQRFVDSGM